MPEDIKADPIVAEKVMAVPVVRETVTKVSLPPNQHFTVVLEGREYCVFAALADTPKEVQDFILALGESQAATLLGR
jgi:hypothetical protein